MSTVSSMSPSSPSILSLDSRNPSSIPTPPDSPADIKSEENIQEDDNEPNFADMDEKDRYRRLTYLLEKSSAYAGLLKDRMDLVKVRSRTEKLAKPAAKSQGKKRRRSRVVEDEDEKVDATEHQTSEAPVEQKFKQPSLITGAKMKDYQLEGLAWMVGLYENGISGILADEMGLGKTLQTIAFNAYLRGQLVLSPFLVVCPLSVLHNWIDEFHKFAPDIPVCMYHGTPERRAELRATAMLPPADKEETKTVGKENRKRYENSDDDFIDDGDDDDDYEDRPKKKARRNSGPGRPTKNTKAKPRKLTQPKESFPVVLTTYEMIIKDCKHLAKYNWGYIVVDEGHRLKNLDCKLMQEIKKYQSAGRMILTGTPLHNNLAELWSLLNFILPDIFGDVNAFQNWFSLPNMSNTLSSSQTSHVVHTLHSILKPFLLRRLKVDVELSLPPKKEYILYAPLTSKQRDIYSAVVDGGLRRFLIEGKLNEEDIAEGKRKEKEEEERQKEDMIKEGRKLRAKSGKVNYNIDEDIDDDAYFEKLEKGEFDWLDKKAVQAKPDVGAAEFHRKAAMKEVYNLKLQNVIMQLRKVCSHPFLFDWPTDPVTYDAIVDDQLVGASGKMMVLERLLDELFRRKHKVLIFSQFTTMLDIIESWALEFKGWDICRIDGKTTPLDRREQMAIFQQNREDTPSLFLLSTRAGGLGINLTAADTVIFYDQDWNPQMDIQAQDRAHRIGQTKPVLIFRLITAHTVENKIMQKAMAKRQLEALVIAKGKFRMPGVTEKHGKKESMAEIAAALLKLEGEKIEVVPNTAAGKASVISDEDLDALLDRRPQVFSARAKGWTKESVKVQVSGAGAVSGVNGDDKKKNVENLKKSVKTAFEVYEGRADETNDALANLMGEEIDE